MLTTVNSFLKPNYAPGVTQDLVVGAAVQIAFVSVHV